MPRYMPTEEDINYIKDNYMNKTSAEIAKTLGCSSSYIKKIGKTISNGNKRSNRYYCNFDYFKEIDSYDKAYWLGFLMADGCIYSRNKDKSQSWCRLSLKSDDENHIAKFKESIGSNHNILKNTKKSGHSYCNINIVSDIFVSNLRKYGCVENKTGKIILPNFNNDELTWAFILVYFDGDGSISKLKDRNVYKYRFSIVGNYELLREIQKFLQKYDINANIREDKREYSFPFYEMYFERMEYCKNFIDNTYLRFDIYLDRKYNRAMEYLEYKYDENKLYYNLKGE